MQNIKDFFKDDAKRMWTKIDATTGIGCFAGGMILGAFVFPLPPLLACAACIATMAVAAASINCTARLIKVRAERKAGGRLSGGRTPSILRVHRFAVVAIAIGGIVSGSVVGNRLSPMSPPRQLEHTAQMQQRIPTAFVLASTAALIRPDAIAQPPAPGR